MAQGSDDLLTEEGVGPQPDEYGNQNTQNDEEINENSKIDGF